MVEQEQAQVARKAPQSTEKPQKLSECQKA